jgi:Xaa-Pro aminopeptidase
MDHQLRRRALAARLDDLGVDAFLVTDLANTRYLTGFTGSNGQILIGRSFELFLTDGRYAEQARREVPGIDRSASDRSYRGAVAERCVSTPVARLGVEAHRMTLSAHAGLAEALGSGVELVATDDVVGAGRRVKDDEERELIRRAQAATDAAFTGILDRFALGVSEGGSPGSSSA